MSENKIPAGWDIPGLSKKFHYFPDGEITSLCGKWMLNNTGNREDSHDDHPDNCAACKKKIKALRKKQGEK